MQKILLAGQFQEFFDEGAQRYKNARFFFFGYNLDSANIRQKGAQLAQYAKNYDTVIVCVANEASRRVAKYLAQSGKRVIVVSALEPVHVFDFDWADSIVLAYSYSRYSFRAAFAALAGDYTPQGLLPLNVRLPKGGALR